MKKKYVLITGSDGLVGSECVDFINKGFSIIGVDNNYRKKFSEKMHRYCGIEKNKKHV